MARPASTDADYTDYVDGYVCAVERTPSVERVYVDASHGLRIYTIYRGSVFEVGEDLARAQAEAMDRFPHTAVDFQFIPADGADPRPPSTQSHQVFPPA